MPDHKILLRIVLCGSLLLVPFSVKSQSLFNINISDQTGLNADSITFSDNTNLIFKRKKPVLSFLLDEKLYTTGDVTAIRTDNNYSRHLKIRLSWLSKIRLHQDSVVNLNSKIFRDTVSISNVILMRIMDQLIYRGKAVDGKSLVFRPGFRLSELYADNAWEMGYTSFDINEGLSVCAIARRMQTEGGQKQRYQTLLPPKAKVHYNLYADIFRGEWQNGLRMMFRDRYLYDLEKFDNMLYERADLAWIKESYLIILQMAWDREFYDRSTGKYTFPDLLRNGIDLFGNIDVYGIWPTWPRLGLDQRNQWDLYRDLPGGTKQLRNFSRISRQNNTRFFIAYNPLDNSTRKEDHYKGMARMIKETEADGVVLDTKGSSSYELQAAADSVRKGVVMYSEGMAITKDMPGIISGRVHNAIFLSPELNLNKLIKPDFSIFRVCDVGEDLIHREIAVAFFNGYGTELNMHVPHQAE
jgi:hypothetical protein